MEESTIGDSDKNRQEPAENKPEFGTHDGGDFATDRDFRDEQAKNRRFEVPKNIAEFEIRRIIGEGGFGAVYEAYDSILQRSVAIKIPHIRPGGTSVDFHQNLHEARAIAWLNHPNIVPVYQASSTPEVPFYIVVRLIHGRTLGEWNNEVQPSFAQIAEVIATIADALGYAHAQNVVHRDVKPSNILVDQEGVAYIADFGLALREYDPEMGPAYVGTPSYMSPEQARGEGHRVDGRSDIFSLGIVLYQLLTGTRPFLGKRSEVLLQIKSVEPPHPNRVNPNVPSELARICIKALSKSLHGRYQRAEEMAAELREYGRISASGMSGTVDRISEREALVPSNGMQGNIATSSSPFPVVPKGLRPFEASDSEFFLQLLPGPYDRYGVPEIIRFWLSRMHNRKASEAVSVGIVYGPSGCGKTSLFRAGILPRLSRDVRTVYLEASESGTEKSLENLLSSIYPATNLDRPNAFVQDSDLARTVARIRRHGERKTVICIDQFEQWLYAHASDLATAPLTQALRQCDGIHLQCILLVRDDFWMGISRLMQALEIPISEHHNTACVDLFDLEHARRVLASFGTAMGKLPTDESRWSVKQKQFVISAIDYLSVGGKVVCVQLALFAEMMKHRPWDDPKLFTQDGGAGIGVAFFEQSFGSDSAPRHFRSHSEGAQRLLRKLLPAAGARIKGAIRTKNELREAVGYVDESAFAELLRILDSELHLITPTTQEDETALSSQWTHSGSSMSEPGYQLTHDFLIAPLRKWLAMRQLSTRAGQAIVRLEEYTELYRVRPQPQSLPSMFEYLNMRWWLPSNSFNEHQRKMLASAKRHHVHRALQWLLVFGLIVSGIFAGKLVLNEQIRFRDEQARAEAFLVADLPHAVEMLSELTPHHTYLRNTLRIEFEKGHLPTERRLRAAFGTAFLDRAATIPNVREFLYEQILSASPSETVTLLRVDCLRELFSRDEWMSRYSQLSSASEEWLRLSAYLVQNETTRQGVLKHIDQLVRLMQSENPLHLNEWTEAFSPIGHELLPAVEKRFLASASRDGPETVNLANMLVKFGPDVHDKLASMVVQAGPSSHHILVSALSQSDDGQNAIRNEIEKIDHIVQDPWNPALCGTEWWQDTTDESSSLVRTAPSIQSDAHRNLLARLQSNGCVMDENFLLSFGISEAELRELEEPLRSLGYRLDAIAPYNRDGECRAMILWKRDGRSSMWIWPASAELLLSRNSEFVEKGFYPASLAEYAADDGETSSFAVVWTKTPPFNFVVNSGFYLDVPSENHEREGWRPFTDHGYLPRTNFQFRNSQNLEFYTSLRWKLNAWFPSFDAWNDNQCVSDETLIHARPDDVLVDAHWSLEADRVNSRGLTQVWWSGLDIESRWTGYAGQDDHMQRCEELRGQGFRPVTIHASADGQNNIEFSSVWWRPRANEEKLAELARRKARLAIALHQLGDSRELMNLLQSAIADHRGAAIDACARYQVELHWMLDRLLDLRVDVAVRRAIANALALLPLERRSRQMAEDLSEHWDDLCSSCDDPGLRSSMLAVQRGWQLSVPCTSEALNPNRELKTVSGKRMVILEPPPLLQLGSPNREPGRDGGKEYRRIVKMPRIFAISTEEVTSVEFLQFDPDKKYATDYCPTEDSPIIDVTWFEAARYCRWLSEQEGVPEKEMCYPPISEIRSGMQLKSDYLNCVGYRLPTEAEWEFAARGGYPQGRHFGFLTELLDQYAWTANNSNYRGHPVGRLLPNDYGLFDMFGNAMEMCQNRLNAYNRDEISPIADPAERNLRIYHEDNMASRGGATLFQPLDARAAHRDDHPAGESRPYLSFRIVRTIRP